MKQEVKYIELMFENCEIVKIDTQYIGTFEIKDVITDIKRIGCNIIGKQLSAKSILIELFDDAKDLRTDYELYCPDYESDKVLGLFERIQKFNDITWVGVYYTDGTNDSIYVPWKDSIMNDEINANMTTTILTPNNNLVIYVGEDNLSYAFKNFFTKEDNNEYIIRKKLIKMMEED